MNKITTALLLLDVQVFLIIIGFSRPAASLRVRGIQKSLNLVIIPGKAKKPGPRGLRRGATL